VRSGRIRSLGTFEKLQKSPVAFVTSVRLSDRIEQLGSHWINFHEILYFRIFREYMWKIRVLLEAYKNKGHFV
jgi:hypothetical protein